MSNIVIGIEGLVGAGKTSICRELLKRIPNSILLNGGNLYRAIISTLLKQNIDMLALKDDLRSVDIKSVMDKLGIEIRIEDRETKFYLNDKQISEKEMQSSKSSLAVSQIGGIANNEHLFSFARDLIDNLKQKYNVIISGRSIMKIYPETDYHFFITALLEERVKRKSSQYNNEIDLAELENQIRQRDELQKQAGFYELSSKTITLDVTDCKTVQDATEKVLEHIELLV